MNAHTPGPWHAVHAGDKSRVMDSRGHIADVYQPLHRRGDTKRHPEQHYINAKFIAAAPDLLEALRDMMELEATWELMAGPQGTYRKWSIDASTRRQNTRQKAKAALAKATS